MSTRVVVTGGSGFLGSLLARRLLTEPVTLGGAPPAELDELTMIDLVGPPDDVRTDRRVRFIAADLSAAFGDLDEVDAVFHLAGVVSGAAEADFDLGMRTNVDGTRSVLEYGRRHAGVPLIVFASSGAVFGSDPAIGPIGGVDDDTLPRPQSSYGIQKFIAEQLVADYTRKGFIRGRSVRPMTVSVRPGRPNAAASGFLSGIIREPLAGKRAQCPVPPDTPVALISPKAAVEGLLRAGAVDDTTWGSRTAMTLPALTTTPREMARALDRVAGTALSTRIDWVNDPAVADIVTTWPAVINTPRAHRLGLHADTSFDDIVRSYLTGIRVTQL
jgi:nucleoside-diphosphate-sugar epimerase